MPVSTYLLQESSFSLVTECAGTASAILNMAGGSAGDKNRVKPVSSPNEDGRSVTPILLSKVMPRVLRRTIST